jgi:hypothetical protein
LPSLPDFREPGGEGDDAGTKDQTGWAESDQTSDECEEENHAGVHHHPDCSVWPSVHRFSAGLAWRRDFCSCRVTGPGVLGCDYELSLCSTFSGSLCSLGSRHRLSARERPLGFCFDRIGLGTCGDPPHR